MNMIKADKENNIRNILQEYKDDVCIADFTCYKKEKQEGEGK